MSQSQMSTYEFQSTLPMRGGTNNVITVRHGMVISIHPPHAGRDTCFGNTRCKVDISIHPPHAGRDQAD